MQQFIPQQILDNKLLLLVFFLVIIWSMVWKAIALWKSSKQGGRTGLAWFIVFLLVNTLGILEIFYIFFFNKHKNNSVREGGFVANIEKETLDNDNFRKVLFTSDYGQLVVMNLLPNEEIGEEIHHVDQFFRLEKGQAKIIIDGKENSLTDGHVAIVPSGSKHNVINTSSSEFLKLYTIYMPPQHKDGTIHKTREEGELDKKDHY